MRGVTNHQATAGKDDVGTDTKFNARLGKAMPDPMNKENVTSLQKAGEYDILTKDESRRAFVQIAALNHGDIKDTHDFLRQSFFPEIRRDQVEKLIEKYGEEVMAASNIAQTWLEGKFENLNLLTEARVVSNGIAFCEKAQTRLANYMDIIPEELGDYEEIDDEDTPEERRRKTRINGVNTRAKKDLERLLRVGNTTASKFDTWVKRRDSLLMKIEAMLIDLTERTSGKSDEKSYMNGKKLSNMMKKHGIDPNIAERVATLIVHGDGHSQNAKKKEQTEKDEKVA